MTPDEIRARTQAVWDRFYSLRRVWERSRCTPTLRARLAFVLLSKLYRQMYANTGIATDSARVNRANRWARFIARPCRHLFTAKPLPGLRSTPDVSPRPTGPGPVLGSGPALQAVEFRSEQRNRSARLPGVHGEEPLTGRRG
jgi:hypothetical protein